MYRIVSAEIAVHISGIHALDETSTAVVQKREEIRDWVGSVWD